MYFFSLSLETFLLFFFDIVFVLFVVCGGSF